MRCINSAKFKMMTLKMLSMIFKNNQQNIRKCLKPIIKGCFQQNKGFKDLANMKISSKKRKKRKEINNKRQLELMKNHKNKSFKNQFKKKVNKIQRILSKIYKVKRL